MNVKHLSRLGLAEGQFLGRAYSDSHSAGDAKRVTEKVEYVFDIGTSVQHEYRDNGQGCYLKTLSPVKDPETGTVTATFIAGIFPESDSFGNFLGPV
jgi:hypothetical protein